MVASTKSKIACLAAPSFHDDNAPSEVGVCAPAASGDAAAAPSSVMNWRRLRSSMGSPSEPAMPAYRRLRMLRKRPLVLGGDLNCSESEGVHLICRRADGEG